MVGILSRVKAAVQGFRYPAETNSGAGYVRGYGAYGDNFIVNLTALKDDLTQAILSTDPLGNSAVMACLGWIMDIWPEAPLKVYKTGDDETLTAEKMPSPNIAIREFQRMLKRPNEDYGDSVLWMGTVLSLKLDGNAYWQKLRNSSNAVIGFMYLPHHLVEPRWPQGGGTYIDHYDYYAGTGTPVRIELADMVHFRDGIDPKNTRKGLSRLKATMRDVFTDDEGGNYTAAILWKMGVIGGMISPDPVMFKDGSSIDGADAGPIDSQEKADAMKDKFERATRGSNRAGFVVSQIPLKYEEFKNNIDPAKSREARRVAEERICAAVFRIPPGVVKLGAGLDRNTFNNALIEEQQAYRGAILPLHRIIDDTLEQQALIDFTDDESFVLGFDTSKIVALQEDEDAKAKRYSRLFMADLLHRDTCQSALGQKPEASDHVYRSEWLQSIGAGGTDKPIPANANTAVSDK